MCIIVGIYATLYGLYVGFHALTFAGYKGLYMYHEGCPSSSWTFAITLDCASGFYDFSMMCLYTYECTNMGGIR